MTTTRFSILCVGLWTLLISVLLRLTVSQYFKRYATRNPQEIEVTILDNRGRNRKTALVRLQQCEAAGGFEEANQHNLNKIKNTIEVEFAIPPAACLRLFNRQGV